MIAVGRIAEDLQRHGLRDWAAQLPAQLEQALGARRHGDLDSWLSAVASLPQVGDCQVELDRSAVTVRSRGGAPRASVIEPVLRLLHPWRKGPYDLFGLLIDAEWRSDWKWERVRPHLAPLPGRRVLDVGCGNGYHAWRMAGAGARLVIGLDPTQLFYAQFQAIRHFLGDRWPVHLLPIGVEDLPPALRSFDTVFSMGVLHHRRSPLDHLVELRDALRPGGELVLETLVIPDGGGEVLVPEGRYAKMRNVWFIPTVPALERWMRRVGLQRVRAVDVTRTTVAEQRATDWMHFESLADFLDPKNAERTVEGHPAPRRAIVLAEALP